MKTVSSISLQTSSGVLCSWIIDLTALNESRPAVHEQSFPRSSWIWTSDVFNTWPGLLVRCLLCVKLDLLCYLSERDVTVRFRKHFFSEAAAPRFIWPAWPLLLRFPACRAASSHWAAWFPVTASVGGLSPCDRTWPIRECLMQWCEIFTAAACEFNLSCRLFVCVCDSLNLQHVWCDIYETESQW